LQVVQLSVKELSIPHTLNCSGDSLTLFDGWNTEGRIIVRLCGTLKTSQTYVSSGQLAVVHFRSDIISDETQLDGLIGFRVNFKLFDQTESKGDKRFRATSNNNRNNYKGLRVLQSFAIHQNQNIIYSCGSRLQPTNEQ
jgi:CUB domain